MTALFISDLHLEDVRPQAIDWLRKLLRGPARTADALYILGDLFETWIGDDVLSTVAIQVADEIAELAASGVACHFQHGNRDFLLGPEYARRAGLRLLPEYHVADLYGTPTLLLHGDTLCTDDAAYQTFRQQVRDPSFQAEFLAKPPARRLEIARQARDASRQYTGGAAPQIMDTNDTAVRAAFREHDVTRIIHGHTHRPAVHEYRLDTGLHGERIVLADWHRGGSYYEVGPELSRSVALPP